MGASFIATAGAFAISKNAVFALYRCAGASVSDATLNADEAALVASSVITGFSAIVAHDLIGLIMSFGFVGALIGALFAADRDRRN